MAGADKGLVPLAGKAMIAHVLQTLQPQVEHTLINANRHLDTYRRFGCPVITDERKGYAGPLAGVASALACIDTPWLLCVPCDVPRLPGDLLARFSVAARTGAAPLYVIRTAEGVQPVFCLIHRSLRDHLTRYLDTNGRKMRNWQQQAGAVEVDYPDTHSAFVNINTQDTLSDLDALLNDQRDGDTDNGHKTGELSQAGAATPGATPTTDRHHD